jgi:hypothetical protein
MSKTNSKSERIKYPNTLSKNIIKEKIKLIYIRSLSNSGSTLLDLILGAMKELKV